MGQRPGDLRGFNDPVGANLVVNDTWGERTSTEELPPPDWLAGISVGNILD